MRRVCLVDPPRTETNKQMRSVRKWEEDGIVSNIIANKEGSGAGLTASRSPGESINVA